MQLNGHIFCGDVVLNSFHMLYRDEDSIQDQMKEKRIFGIFIMTIINFGIIEENVYMKKYSTLQQGNYNIVI